MITFDFLFLPVLSCILIVLINVYFGIHVIKREIIFIDIALAQIAAFGGVIGGLLISDHSAGHEHGEGGLLSYILSVAFIFFASLMFSVLKNKKISIPLEAIIGMSFAVATTLTVIILDKAAGGDVHVHDMLIGSLLWVSGKQVIRLAVVVGLVSIFHIIFRKKFMKLTDTFDDASSSISKPGVWDFLFYFSFGLVVIEAVNIAGILTVFAFLIIPASLSVIIARSWTWKIISGWITGITAAVAGIILSVKMDIPSPPVIIILLGIFLVVGYIVYKAVYSRVSSAKEDVSSTE